MGIQVRSRDYYTDTDIDFGALAQRDDEFRQLWEDSKQHLDWQSPETVQILTKALLRQDFGLQLTLPSDRLCPPVPVRWNYIRWIQQLLDTSNDDYTDAYDDDRQITGLDIGVGASCIYGLLACAARPNWRMFGTDVDEHSLRYAQQNIDDNDLESRIKLIRNTLDAPLLPDRPLDFVVCNPPFYESEADMNAAYGYKDLPPSAVCTGSVNEMICTGGDLGFALRILHESLVARERIQWYSCMFGRLESAKNFVIKLKEHNISNFAATNLKAGQKTVRWAIAWSMSDLRPRNDIARHGSLTIALLPQATERTVRVVGVGANKLAAGIDDFMNGLDLQWTYDPETKTGLAISFANVWSRSARRKKMQGTGESAAMVVRIVCSDEQVDVRWLRGHDALLIESFAAKIKALFGVRDQSRYKK